MQEGVTSGSDRSGNRGRQKQRKGKQDPCPGGTEAGWTGARDSDSGEARSSSLERGETDYGERSEARGW
jgi:hypothetical protein